MAKGKRSFGNTRKLPSKRWQARYTDPDGNTVKAPCTFDTRRDAEAWLALEQSKVIQGQWKPATVPAETPASEMTVREYADAWLVDRDLAVRTRELYRALLRNHIYPTFGETRLVTVTARDVRAWHASMATRTGATARAHAYSLLHAVFKTAVDDDLVPANPCKIRRAGQSRRQNAEPAPMDVQQVSVLVNAMPAKYRLLILLAGWCAPRFGEVTELRRRDVDLRNEKLRIHRSVAVTTTGRVVKSTKNESFREVAIPPHLIDAVQAHLAEHTAPGADSLLFPSATGGHLSESTLRKHFHKARLAAGRPDFRFHDLRHTAGTWAAQAGASLKELMDRLGHTTVQAAMRYQHTAANRDQAIAARLSELAEQAGASNVTSIAEAPSVKGVKAKDKKRRRA